MDHQSPAEHIRLMRPQIRPGLQAAPHQEQLILWDAQRIAGPPQILSAAEFEAVRRFTGQHSLADIHLALQCVHPQEHVSIAQLIELVHRLDQALFLDSQHFVDYVLGPVRRPSCIGCYPHDPAGIHDQLRGLFTHPDGPGWPADPTNTEPHPIRALFVPHMDYARGGATYGWGYRKLIERTQAKLFVIIATSHYSPHRFTLTRKHFETPLGRVETDIAYVERIAEAYGPGVFEDTFAHLPEHSIELEVVMLQHLYAGSEPFRIVPLLVGSFHDCVATRRDPASHPEIARMIQSLKKAEAAAGESVCYIISGDLAHIGPKFGDPEPVSDEQLSVSLDRDKAILQAMTTGNPSKLFDTVAEERDARRICGLPPAWLTLAVTEPSVGAPLHYGRYIDTTGHESVSFAAVAFQR